MLACGKNASVIVTSDGELHSTGVNTHGQIGHGMAKCKWFFEKPKYENGLSFLYVSVFDRHMAAVDNSGEVHVCGNARDGRLGIGVPSEKFGFNYLGVRKLAEVQVQYVKLKKISMVESLQAMSMNMHHNVQDLSFFEEKMLKVACGSRFTLALSSAGRVWATGANSRGQLGLNDHTSRYFFTSMENFFSEGGELLSLPHVVDIAAGSNHSMMLCKNGNLFVCGDNDSGSLGLGDRVDRLGPTLVEQLFQDKVCRIAAGVWHSLAITDEGHLYTWGKGWYGQLGHGTGCDLTLPKKVWLPETRDDFVIMASGGLSHTVFLCREKTVWSCGRGCHGSLCTGDIGCRMIPARIDTTVIKNVNKENEVMIVVCGHDHTGIVASDGTLYMCGRGDGGNIWFKKEDGPGGLSLERQVLPRLTPVIVKKRKGLNFQAPISVGPALAWRKRMSELVLAFCIPILMHYSSEVENMLLRALDKGKKAKDEETRSGGLVFDLTPDLLGIIAKMVLCTGMPEYQSYHKSSRMLVGEEN